MRNTQPLLTLFNSQCAVWARVCLPGPKDDCKTIWHRCRRRKSIGVDLNFNRLAIASAAKRHTLRYPVGFKSP